MKKVIAAPGRAFVGRTRVILGILLVSLCALPAFAQETLRVAIDVDNSTQTGCAFQTLDGSSFPGVEYILEVSLAQGDVKVVDSVRVLNCNGQTVWSNNAVWPVGEDNGLSGADVIEAYMPLNLFQNAEILRFYFETRDQQGNYDILSSGAGGPITFTFPFAIPALSPWNLAIYVAVMLLAAFLVIRNRKRLGKGGTTLALFLVAAFLLAAPAFTPDGQIDDWDGQAPLALDPVGDDSGGGSSVDLLGVFVCNSPNSLAFRFDMVNVGNRPPVAVDDAAIVAEDGLLVYPVLNNDSDPDVGDSIALTGVGSAQHGNASIMGSELRYAPDLDFSGNDSVSYTIVDSRGAVATATLIITITPSNDNPIATDDSSKTAIDVARDIAVLANDYDPDGDPLSVADVSASDHGIVNINGDGTVRYTPGINFVGTDTFSYTVIDPSGQSDMGQVTIEVVGLQTGPSVGDDTATVIEGGSVVIHVLFNDIAFEGRTLFIVSLGQPQHGSAAINADQTVSYTPDPGFTGVDTFEYTVSDEDGNTATAIVTVTVQARNVAPRAVDDFAVTEQNQAVTVNVLANDFDANPGDSLLITGVGSSFNGSVVVDPGGMTVTYTPDNGFNGDDFFSYTIQDTAGLLASALVRVQVTLPGQAPAAINDFAVTDEDQAVVVNVLANDRDPGGAPFQVVEFTQPANGSTGLTPEGSIQYTPSTNFNGTDTFTYKVRQGVAEQFTALVTVTVNPVADAPVAVADNAATDEDTPVEINVLANDSDPDAGVGEDTLDIVASTPAIHGTTAIFSISKKPENGKLAVTADQRVRYIPNNGFSGMDLFSYSITGKSGISVSASVSVAVAMVNDAPVANDDTVSTPPNTPISIAVLDNDTDEDGTLDTASVTLVSAASNGATQVNGDGSIDYTPNNGFTGTDSFTYTVRDDMGAVSNQATVSITVDDPTPPTANDDSYTVNKGGTLTIDAAGGILANDDSPQGFGLSASLVSDVAHGSLALSGDGAFAYIHDDGADLTDSFTYMVNDGINDSNVATVTISINNGPGFTSSPVTFAAVDVLYSYAITVTDANGGDVPNITAPTLPSWLTLNPARDNAAASLSGTPTAGDVGDHSVSLLATDGQGLTANQDFTITVSLDNQAPEFTSAAVTAATEDTAYTYNITATDPDVGDNLTITAPTLPAWLGLSDNGDGSAALTGTPDAGDVGDHDVSLLVTDDGGLTDTQDFTITVSAPDNEAPEFTSVAVTAATQDAAYTYNITATDPDVGDNLTITAPTLPAWMGFSDNGDGTAALTGTPTNDEVGDHDVSLLVTDDGGLTDTQDFTITVANVNDAPSFTSAGPTGGTQDSVYTYNITTSDPDTGDSLTITAPTLPGWLMITDNGNGTATLTGTPTNADLGANPVSLQVADAGGLTDTQNFTITVSDTNDAPSFTSMPVTDIDEDVAYTYNITATDPDPGDTLTITALIIPAWLSLVDNGDGTATLSGTPDNDDVGADVVELQVEDSGGLTGTQIWILSIFNVNDPPMFTSVAITGAAQDTAYTYNITTTDPDDRDNRTITAPTLPGWLMIVDNGDGTATLSGTPTNAEVGMHNVSLRVADVGGLTDTQSFTITVSDSNDAPSFTSMAVTAATEDSAYTYNITATDPDVGDTLTITIVTNPGWLMIVDNGNGTATLSGTPDNGDVGPNNVTIRVTDGGGLTADQMFTITVSNTNDSPSFTSMAVTGATEDALYTYSVTFTDPDSGDTPVLTAPTLPAWLGLSKNKDGGSGTLSGTPTNADVGMHSVTLQITDAGMVMVQQNFTITVANVNDPPTFTSMAVTSADEDALYTYNVTFTDPDAGDTPVLTAPTIPAWLGLSKNKDGGAGTLSGTPTQADVGMHNVTLQITDGSMVTAQQSFTITVAATPEDLTYATAGNTELVTGDHPVSGRARHAVASGVLAGEMGMTVTSLGPFASDQGGTVTMEADGDFSYIPPAGVEGDSADSFEYTVNTGATATVTLHIRNDQIWFVDASVAKGGGDGRSHNPFSSLAAAQAVAGTGDIIYVYHDAVALNETIALKGGQKLIGEGFGLSGDVDGSTVTLHTVGTHPVLNHPAGIGVTITDVDGTEVRGMNITGNTFAINVTATDGSTVGLTLDNNIIGGGSTAGIGLDNSNTGALNAVISNNAISSTGHGLLATTNNAGATMNLAVDDNTDITAISDGIHIDGAGGGTLVITSFANNTVHGDSAGKGISVNFATFDATPGGMIQVVDGGNTVIGDSGNRVANTAMALTTVGGHLSFTDLDLFGGSGAALQVNGTGFFDGVNGFRLDVAGTSVADCNLGPALVWNLMTAMATFSSVNSTNSTTTGVQLISVRGSVTMNSATITNPTGTGFNLTGADATVVYSGSITNATGRTVAIQNTTGGSVTFNTGTVTATGGTGIQVNNTAGTVSFASVDMDNLADTAVTIEGTAAGNVTFTALDINTVSGGANNHGVAITGRDGGTITFSDLAIQGAAGTAFNVHSTGGAVDAAVNVTVDGTTGITNSSGLTVSIEGTTANGDVTFSGGTVTATGGTGILINNTAGDTSFADVDMDNLSDTAVTISGANNGGVTFTALDINTVSGGAGNHGVNIIDRTGGILTFSDIAVQGTTGNAFRVAGTSCSVAATPNAGTGISKSSAGNVVNVDGISGGGVQLIFGPVNATGMASGVVVQNVSAGTVNITDLNAGTMGARLGGPGIALSGNTGGTFSFLDADIFTTGADAINATGSGTFNLDDGDAGSVTLDVVSGHAINLNGPALIANISSLNVNNSGGGTHGVSITNSTGTKTVDALGITTSAGTGIIADGAGTFNVNGATNTIAATGGAAVNINNTITGMTFQTLGATNSTLQGIDLTSLGNSSSFAVTGTTTINGTTNEGIRIDTTGANADIDFATVNIDNRGGTGILFDSIQGDVDFGATTIPNQGNVGGYGIRCDSTSATVTFASTTISAANETVAETDPGNDLLPDNEGDGDGIYLDGNSGTFTINGGSISNVDGDGIDARSLTASLNVTGMTITTPGQHGFRGIFMTGTHSFTNSVFTQVNNANTHGALMLNTNQTLGGMTFDNCDFHTSTTLASFVFMATRGTGNMTLNVQNGSEFFGLAGEALQTTAGDDAGVTGDINTNISNSTFRDAAGVTGSNSIFIGSAETNATNTVNIDSNTFSNIKVSTTPLGNESVVRFQTNGGTLAGTISGNTIHNTNGRRNGLGIVSEPAVGKTASVDLTIDGNDIDDIDAFQFEGIFISLRERTTDSEISIINNNVGQKAGSEGDVDRGIFVQTRDSGGGAFSLDLLMHNNVFNMDSAATDDVVGIDCEDNTTINMTVTANTFTHSNASAQCFDAEAEDAGSTICLDMNSSGAMATQNTANREIEVERDNGGTYRIEGLGADSAAAAVAAFLNANNNFTGTITALDDGGLFLDEAGCPSP